MESLPIELLHVISHLNYGFLLLIILSHTSRTLNLTLKTYIKDNVRKYMVIVPTIPVKGYSSEAMLLSEMQMKHISMQYSGYLAKAVSSARGCLMVIGIDDYCYIKGENTYLKISKSVVVTT